MSTLPRLNALPDDAVFDLPDYGVIGVTGEQRHSYLHGQLTVNTNKLAADDARRSAHCDAKGKTWSVMLVSQTTDKIFLSLPKGTLEASLSELKKYGVFSKVELVNESDRLSQVVIKGHAGIKAAERLFSKAPSGVMKTVSNDNGIVLALDYPQDCLHFILTFDGLTILNNWISEQALARFDQPAFEALAIKAGVPEITGPSVSEYVPQMINIQALNGIDFDKGCYMGQETIARTRYLGKNKRQAYSFSLPEATNIAVGDIVEKQLGDNWRRAGSVIRCATLEQETWLLAVLPNDTSAEDVHRLATLPQMNLTLTAQAYTIDDMPSSKPLKRGS